MLSGVEKALLAILLITLMMGMGATLDRSSVRGIAKSPKGILIGLASQFGWMPLVAFGLAKALSLPNELALGLVIVGCTPGGTTSNLFAYFSKADVALSIGMTAVSTAVAIVAMPAVLWLYGSAFTSTDIALPIRDIIITLLLVLLPVGIGMAIRAKSETAAKWVERVGAGSGLAVLCLLVSTTVFNQRATFAQIPANAHVAAIALGLVGMALGYVTATAVTLNESERRAVALETGIQNSALAIGIVVATFPEDQQELLLRLPLLYALYVLISASFITVLFRWRPGPLKGLLPSTR
ncbi:MAG: BASS family bile acid:Na+ symporter [Myxococcota bacterium]|jgi:BASS family bile acid:Na+ symporter